MNQNETLPAYLLYFNLKKNEVPEQVTKSLKIKNLNDINTSTEEGKMLFSALSILTCSPAIAKIGGGYQNGEQMTPFEILDKLNEMKEFIFENKESKEEYVPQPLSNEVYTDLEKAPAQEVYEISLHEAVTRLKKELQSDEEYYYAWKANIATQMFDAVTPNNPMDFRVISRNEDASDLCNKAADNFLQILIHDSNQDND